ncbi:TIGR01777 family oxidoreductase [Polaribacter sp. MSW13]|uniref:TIGR01777 family oxidoreductase n=1 Tax=Polaribacter marinus TaxID=2916838 RepID=A0A9X1VP15_9FLAO|nr:TIGR01777 family oxidoreductase [Polaribacter marinus]MCI2230104.1 TIGR01777 family oxidoreductase [Polaribacter marinus]
MAKILITGGTGLVGTRLTKMLIEQKHEVAILSRTPKNKNEYKWNVSKDYIDDKAFLNVDYIIHLAGAGIADKNWSEKRKKLIIDSRVKTTNLLFKKVIAQKLNLKGFVSASGIGYYGAITSTKIFKETDKPGNDYLSEVCKKWEQAALQFEAKKIPVTLLRTGIVISKKGGALQKMKTPIISPLGSGKQYLPWIHIDDLCNMYISVIEQQLEGIYNAVAPEHQTSKSFSKLLANNLKRPYIKFGVPSLILQLIFGEMSVLLLKGSRISADKIIETGFKFKFPTLQNTFKNLF